MPSIHSKECVESQALTHDKCRDKICVICYSESGYKASRIVTASQEKLIRHE